MKLNKYGRPVTTKTQWIWLAIGLGGFFITNISTLIFAEEAIEFIIGLAISFTILIIGTIGISIDSKRIVKQAKIETQRHQDISKIYEKHWEKVYSFSYEKSSNEEKKIFLLSTLFYATASGSLKSFYLQACVFKKEEIRHFLSGILDDEFDEFLNNVILNLKETDSIKMFCPQISCLLDSYVLGEKIPVLKEALMIDPTRHHRFYIEKRTKHNDFVIIEDEFKDRYNFLEWKIGNQLPKKYKTYELALESLSKLFNERYGNFDLEKFNKTCEIDIEEYKLFCLQKFTFTDQLSESESGLIFYDCAINDIGHMELFSRNKDSIDELTRLLMNILPYTFFSKFKEACKALNTTNEALMCSEADAFYKNNYEAILILKRQIANKIKIPILE